MSSERSALLHNKDKISVSQMTQTPPQLRSVQAECSPQERGHIWQTWGSSVFGRWVGSRTRLAAQV